jgi:hypothetical protein
MVCMIINKIPAGIKDTNTYGICIENVDNFDTGKNAMDSKQIDTIVAMKTNLL